MTTDFKGERFQPKLIQQITDRSCKRKGVRFFSGAANVQPKETFRTGQDLYIDGSTIPDFLKAFLPVIDGQHSFELTTRTRLSGYEQHTIAANDLYNVPERRVRVTKHDGTVIMVKDYTALIEFPWLGDSIETFYDRLLTPAEARAGYGIEQLDAERQKIVRAYEDNEFARWEQDGHRAVMVMFKDILSEFNRQSSNMASTTDPRWGARQSFVTRIPSKMKIRFDRFVGKIY